jgi:glycosyltransferase involved in cell wall biosynthesis
VRVVLSLPASPAFPAESGRVGRAELEVRRRSPDAGRTGWTKRRHHLGEGLDVLRGARDADALILCTVGIEAVVAGATRPVTARRTAVVVADPLLPRRSAGEALLAVALRGVDRFAVVRSADAQVLARRFGVPASRITFVPFPVPSGLFTVDAPDGEYVYSAGWAHRDWPTLVSALSDTDWPAVLAPRFVFDLPISLASRVRVIPLQPAEGRRYMQRAGVVALSFLDTDLPSGPLVLLDALAMGKPVVVSDVAGARDYLIDRTTALLVPPGDPQAMAEALTELRRDRALRTRLGVAARQWCREADTASTFVRRLVGLAVDAAARRNLSAT